ncbi:MAG: MMPL family transporter [Bacteroidota bacterium]
MERVFAGLRPVIRWVTAHAWLVFGLGLLLSVGGAYYTVQLRIDTDLSKLLPPDYTSVQALERLRATVGGESKVAVAIVSPSFEANTQYAEALIPEALTLTRGDSDQRLFTRADYRRDVTFLENNALYFATLDELDDLQFYLEDKIEAAKLDANPFFFDLGDEDEEGDASEEDELVTVFSDLDVGEYTVSEDSTVLVVQFVPAGSLTDIGYLRELYTQLEALTASLDPSSFHPDMEITVAGRPLRQLTEIETIQKDVVGSFGVGMATVLLVVILYFLYKAQRAQGQALTTGQWLGLIARAPVMALLIGLPLVMSLSWTFGLTYLLFEDLNLMTSTLGLVLFGLGIDYGIHFYARYTEERARGQSLFDAIELTFMSTGQAITVGALTTSAGLYVLLAADFKGFSEFGFIAGTGILLALLSMLYMLPCLLVIFERLRLLRFTPSGSPTAEGVTKGGRFPAARGIVIGSTIMVIGAIVFIPLVEFEYDFGALEPVYDSYDAKAEVIGRASSGRTTRNPAYIVVDDPDEVEPIIDAIRMGMFADTLSPTIDRVESLQDRFPQMEDQQDEKLDLIAGIRELLDDPLVQAEMTEELARVERAAQTREPIALEQVPLFLKDAFMSKSGEIGNFIIIYPAVGLSDGRQSMAFSEDVGRVEADGKVYYAGSTSLVAADMLKLMQAEAPYMIAGAFLMVALLMWINFGSLRWAMLALLPLIVGILWMFLFMEVFSFRINFYNLIVLPAILGIGNDAGAHIVHRYREEGEGSILGVLRSTGEHVAVGSMTTLIGFAGPLLSFHPGLASIGELAVIGILATLIAALLYLPALLQRLEDSKTAQHDS